MQMTVRVFKAGEPVAGAKVLLWWRGLLLTESGSTEYTGSDGRAIFTYSTDSWPGDAVEIYVNEELMQSYHSPEKNYEFDL